MSLITDWLSPAYHNPRVFRAKYVKASPFAHANLGSFLRADKAKALAAAIRKQEFSPKESDLFKMNETNEMRFSADRDIAALREFLSSKEFSEWLSIATGVKLTNKDFDMSGSRYDDTCFLLCHDDRVTGRKIAYILYLCEDFTSADGGALVLFSDKAGRPGRVLKRYYPKFNSFGMFTVSKKSWHAVEEVLGKKSRYSIHGWFH